MTNYSIKQTFLPYLIAQLAWLVVLLLATVQTTGQEPEAETQESPASATESDEKSKEWTQLFNGKDLSGWTPKIRGCKLGENWNDTFRVEDGVIKVGYGKYDEFDNRFGHLFYKDPYSDYLLRVEYRFVGEQVKGGPGWAYRNSGIMIHGQDPATLSIDQAFPASIEVQLLGGNGKAERTNLNLCTPGTNVVINGKLVTKHCINSTSPTFHGDQWVTVEIEVRGNQVIRHRVNGETVLEYNRPQLDPKDKLSKGLVEDENLMLHGGSISLQSESHPCEFRKVEIKLLRD